jgi:hypothetical protein
LSILISAEIDKYDIVELCRAFCSFVGIKAARCCLYDDLKDDYIYYRSVRYLDTPPKGWEKAHKIVFAPHNIYPDITSPENFVKLINVQWKLFGTLRGECYTDIVGEPFEHSYIRTRLKALKLAQTSGIRGEMFDEYIKELRKVKFRFIDIKRMM